jgi:UDP-N-acetylmuramate--alanine ligase
MAEQRYFFCGIGGSGMLPLAMFLHESGEEVVGSDRAFDQGRNGFLAERLTAAGIPLFPQDGSGLTASEQVLVTSSAVEATIPDVEKAHRLGCDHRLRADLLSSLLNGRQVSCGVAGTSGKSTTTAMLAHILSEAGPPPAVINGAPMLNVRGGDGAARAWQFDANGPFVCEVDESDGTIAKYDPSVGVVLNISEDHKSLAELESLFRGYLERSGTCVIGIDSPVSRTLAGDVPDAITFSLDDPQATYFAEGIERSEEGLTARVKGPGGASADLGLPLIGTFNIANALGAIAAAGVLGVAMPEAVSALGGFAGSARRLETLGVTALGTVIDDFAHNPDKIGASLRALHHHYPRVTLLYQPHGYGPLRMYTDLYEKAFRDHLRPDDRFIITEPVYFGGTVTRSDDAERIASGLSEAGLDAHYVGSRDEAGDLLRARPGEAVVVMGARDDGLTLFARELVNRFGRFGS